MPFYAVNVTAGADSIQERAEVAVDHGANMVMVDVLKAGFSALEVLSRNECPCSCAQDHARALYPG